MSRSEVLVVSTNPAVDVEWRVSVLRPEEKNEVRSERRWPGGKGVNVARWLGWCGVRARLLLPLGGDTGRELAAGLRRERIPHRTVPISGATRANVVVTTDEASQYRLNPTWPVLAASELARFEAELERQIIRHRWVIFSGALVRGADAGFYARWARFAREAGATVVVDCDGMPFRQAVDAGPFLVKPNEFELAQWDGNALPREIDQREAIVRLAAATGGWVLLSRGAKGAWLAGPGLEDLISVPARKARVRNTVGAGDALLAGAVAAALRSPDNPRKWLDGGVRVAAMAVRQEPGAVPPPVGRRL